MGPVIVTPDVELWGVGWLRTALEARDEDYASDVFVSNSRPSAAAFEAAGLSYPDRMVTLRRDGGQRADLLYSVPRLGVNVWAASEQDATDLALLVEGLLLSVRASGSVESVRSLSGPSAVADSTPRRFFTVELTMRGAVA